MIWENLNIDEFEKAISKSQKTVLVPIGCLEKHGSHMPIGSDIIISRYVSIKASEKEDVVVFPFFPFGMVGEVKHKKGTVSLTSKLLFNILEELCDELARNGFEKIIFVDGHGGNQNFLKYFIQTRLENYHPYIVYYFDVGEKDSSFWIDFQNKFGEVEESGHADIFESSCMCAINENLINLSKVNVDETKSLNRLKHIKEASLYTSILWYSDYPNQIAGDPSKANSEIGNYVNNYIINKLTNSIKVVKEDSGAINLLNEYYSKHNKPDGF